MYENTHRMQYRMHHGQEIILGVGARVKVRKEVQTQASTVVKTTLREPNRSHGAWDLLFQEAVSM